MKKHSVNEHKLSQKPTQYIAEEKFAIRCPSLVRRNFCNYAAKGKPCVQQLLVYVGQLQIITILRRKKKTTAKMSSSIGNDPGATIALYDVNLSR